MREGKREEKERGKKREERERKKRERGRGVRRALTTDSYG